MKLLEHIQTHDLTTQHGGAAARVRKAEGGIGGGKYGERVLPTDEVSLSDDVRLFEQLKAKAKGVAEVRDDLVASLRQRLAAGEYRVDTALLAEKLLEGR